MGKTFKPLGEAFRILAWGCGAPSTALGVMSARGDLEPLDAIIHADTGFETSETVSVRDWYTSWFREHGIHVEIVSAGDIRATGAKEHIHVPFWTDGGGPLMRQCTRWFKVIPSKRAGRRLLGYHPTKSPHPPAKSIEKWFGFTLDEWSRLSDSRVRFMVHRFPLFEKRWTRGDCIGYLESHKLPVPRKSACLCCPFRSASEWLYIKEHYPADWQAAVEFDERNRYNPLAERGGSTADALYVYRHCVPLREADLEADAKRERKAVGFQPLLPCIDSSCWT